jgi:hypothetical protein
MDPDPDPATFVIDLQDAIKKVKINFKNSAYYLLFEGTFTSFFSIKSPKEVTKEKESKFFLLFLLDDRKTLLALVLHVQ